MELHRIAKSITLLCFLLLGAGCQAVSAFNGTIKSPGIDAKGTFTFDYNDFEDEIFPDHSRKVLIPFTDKAFSDVLLLTFTTETTKTVAITGLPGAGGEAFLIPPDAFDAFIQKRRHGPFLFNSPQDSLVHAVASGQLPARRMTGTVRLSEKYESDLDATVDLHSDTGDVLKGTLAHHPATDPDEVKSTILMIMLWPVALPVFWIIMANDRPH